MQLSILIPTYKQVCLQLVRELHRQAIAIADLQFEILVADDATPSSHPSVDENRQIDDMTHCHLFIHDNNLGRSANRNFLAKQARYPYLLYIDSHMAVRNGTLLSTYLHHISPDTVIYGGYDIPQPLSDDLRHNLRALYEQRFLQHGQAAHRQQTPYRNLHTANLLIPKNVHDRLPFDEQFRQYGYEDVVYGKQLEKENIPVLHVDNPVFFHTFEPNFTFIEKTEQAIAGLCQHKEQLNGYSRLLDTYGWLKRRHLLWAVKGLHKMTGRLQRRLLTGSHPNVTVFQWYKLGLYTTSVKQNKHITT